MKIHIVNYETKNPWILSKIAQKLKENLELLGHSVSFGGEVNFDADINHHITYSSYQKQTMGVHTLMITHVDNIVKLNKIKDHLISAKVGICMSKATAEYLITLGISPSQLDFAHCAHDSNFIDRKISLGFTTRIYADGRKNESFIGEIVKKISPNDFKFEIMGYGWADVVSELKVKGFEVNYFEDFDYDEYKKLFTRLDYYLYLGNDEGSMGFIDALAAGVKTIVQPQGFHLDAYGGITHAFSSLEELLQIFDIIVSEKHKLQASVEKWTWENYAKKHIEIWEKCLNYTQEYKSSLSAIKVDKYSRGITKLKLIVNYIKQKSNIILNFRRREKFPSGGPRFFGNKEGR